MTRAAPGNSSCLLLAFTLARRRLVSAPRSRILQRNLQLLNCGLRKDYPVVAEKVIRMHFVSSHQLNTFQVSRTEFEIAIAVLRHLDQQRRLVDFQFVEGFAEQLALRFLHIKGIDDSQLAVSQL